MTFPDSLPIKELEKCAPGYDREKLTLYQALYDGGSAVEAVKTLLLPVREIEEQCGGADSKHYQERLSRAPYNRATAGFIDWLVAAVFRETPRLVVSPETPSESVAFYQDLEQNADGRGTPLAALLRDTVLECVLHRRAYPSINFPAAEIDPAAPETMAGRLRLLRAREVEDWNDNVADTGASFYRWHGLEFVRDEKEPWKQAERQRHVWVYFHGKGCEIYEAYRKGTTFGSGEWEAPEAKRVDSKAWSGPTVFPVEYRTGQWIMEATYDTARALFIRDSSIEHLADKFAFQVLVLNVDRPIDGRVFLPDLAAFHLRPGESISFAAPSTAVLTPLFESAKKLREDLLASIHASAQNAASIPQAGRLSGQAVEHMREPLHALLESFAWPVLEAWNVALAQLAAVRGDPLRCARIEGLSQFSATPAELKGVVYGEGRDETSGVAEGAGGVAQPGRADGDSDSLSARDED